MLPKDAEGHLRLAEEIELVDTWKAMERLVDKGLCKAIGLSNFNSKQGPNSVHINCFLALILNQTNFNNLQNP